MKFLIENELEKRHKKHKKTIKPGAMGSFIHSDGGNQVAIDTFNNSVDMSNTSSSCGLREALNESYDSKFKDIINYIKSILPKDTYFSYDDYRIIPDSMGSGMRFQVEFDSKDSSLQDKVINSIERKFYGVTANKGWGRDWDYYITIKVDDRACNESLNEDYAEDHLKRLISIQYPVEKDDNIQLFTTPRGNYLVKVNGKSLLTLGKENFRESDIENLRLDGYFTDYDELRMNGDLNESIETYINKEDKVTKSKFLKEFRNYPVGTYIRLCAKGNINDISQYTYGKVKTKDNEWAAYSSFYGIQDTTCDDQHIIDLIDRKNIKNIGVKLPKQPQAINEDLKDDINIFIEDSRGYSDYNQIIDDVADEFNLSKKEAENYVWEYFYNEGHSVENSYTESINLAESHKDEYESIDLGYIYGTHWGADVNEEKGIEIIKQYHPYDDAEYCWAKSIDGGYTFSIFRAGKKIETFKADPDQEWNDIIAEMDYLDKDVKPKMLYDSLDSSLKESANENSDTLAALKNFKKHAEIGDQLTIDINGNKGEVSKEADGWYLYYDGLVTQGSYKIIEATIKDILDRNSEKDIFLSEDYSKEEKRSDFIKALKLCAAYDPNTLYIDDYSQKQAAEAKNKEINTAFDKIMMKYNVKSTGVPAECTNLKSESDYINKLKQYIAKNKKVMRESFDPYSIEYWNYEPDEIEVGIEYCKNNFIDPTSLTPTDFENIVILANGYYPHNEGWKYTDAEILSALDYILEKGMMLSSLTPENFEEVIKKANALDECAKMTNKEIKEDVPGGQYYWPGSEEEWESEEDIYGDEEIPFDDSLEKSCDMKESRMTNKEIKEALNKLDMWAIDNDTTFYDLKTLYEAFVNPKSPIDQKKKDKIQKALNDPTMNRDTEKLQDYIAGILVRQDEALEETLAEDEDFNNFQQSSKILPVNTLGTLSPDELTKLELRRDELLDKEDHNKISPEEKKELVKLNKKINNHYKEKKRLMHELINEELFDAEDYPEAFERYYLIATNLCNEYGYGIDQFTEEIAEQVLEDNGPDLSDDEVKEILLDYFEEVE